MQKIYIKASSKAAVNDMVLNDTAYGWKYTPDGICDRINLRSLSTGDIVVRYTKRVGGNPVAAAYYTWSEKKKACR